jgi:hypothetical protein
VGRREENGHVRQGVANRDRLDIGDNLRPGRVGRESKRFVRRQLERLVVEAISDHL